MKKNILHITLAILTALFIQTEGVSQKTDTVYHINGNVLTGDFKKMVYGVATWKMDGMGTISLEEVKINTMRSSKLFEIKLNDGIIHFGSFDTSNVARKVYIVETGGRVLIDIEDIVEVYPIRRNFWMRSSGNFSLGANFSKGSNVGSIAFSGDLDYRKKENLRATYMG